MSDLALAIGKAGERLAPRRFARRRPVRSELAHMLVALDKESTKQAWERFYAERLLGRVSAGSQAHTTDLDRRASSAVRGQ